MNTLTLTPPPANAVSDDKVAETEAWIEAMVSSPLHRVGEYGRMIDVDSPQWVKDAFASFFHIQGFTALHGMAEFAAETGDRYFDIVEASSYALGDNYTDHMVNNKFELCNEISEAFFGLLLAHTRVSCECDTNRDRMGCWSGAWSGAKTRDLVNRTDGAYKWDSPELNRQALLAIAWLEENGNKKDMEFASDMVGAFSQE